MCLGRPGGATEEVLLRLGLGVATYTRRQALPARGSKVIVAPIKAIRLVTCTQEDLYAPHPLSWSYRLRPDLYPSPSSTH